MLFPVIEHFRRGDPKPIGERFAREGRMLPDGVRYQASWIDPAGARCVQIMEAPDAASLRSWVDRWDDLIEFEVISVVTSTEYWPRV